MADYIYTMEIRLTPDQQRGVKLVQDIARNAGMNVYLTGGAVRDIISGFPIRDLDFTVQGNPFKLQKDLERQGVVLGGTDEDSKTLYLTLPGNVRAELSTARTESYEKTGKPPVVSSATIIEDLRRRDFTVNAMALSLNAGSLGLLMDPFNGAADIEAKLLRVLHNYAFIEDPSRLIRALRFAARFNWPIEERTQARFDSARENNYIEHITSRAIGREIEQLAYEDDPLNVLRALEKEHWLKVLNQHWTTAKVDSAGLAELLKVRQQMLELGYATDPAAAMLYFLTSKLNEKDIAEVRKLIPRKDLIERWRDLEDNAKGLAKRLSGKEASTPSRAWKLLSETQPELLLFLAVTTRQQGVSQKIKNFFTKWRQVQQKIPLAEMTELRITPQMPEYPKIANDVFMLLLDGRMRSHSEVMKFLKPLAPPPPPPPPPPPAKRGRAAKAVATGVVPSKPGRKRKGEVALPTGLSKDQVSKEESSNRPLKGGTAKGAGQPYDIAAQAGPARNRIPKKQEAPSARPVSKQAMGRTTAAAGKKAPTVRQAKPLAPSKSKSRKTKSKTQSKKR